MKLTRAGQEEGSEERSGIRVNTRQTPHKLMCQHTKTPKTPHTIDLRQHTRARGTHPNSCLVLQQVSVIHSQSCVAADGHSTTSFRFVVL